jgi:hypothetical protein
MTYNTEQFQNQTAPTAVLVEPITAIATSCIVSNPANFPSLAAGQQFRMAIQDTPNSPIEQIVVTAISGPTFTITRGAAAISHVAGAAAAAVVTNDQFSAMYPNGGVETAGGPYNFDGTLPVMEINNASPAATAITILTEKLVPFRVYYIADGAGNAGADHITITPDSGLIGGASNYIISTNNGALRFYWNGTGCRVV